MALAEMKKQLRSGRVYRRSDLAHWSNAVDRHMRLLVDGGDLVKIAGGLYMKPKRTRYGQVSAKPEEVVRAFLGDDQFLMFCFIMRLMFITISVMAGLSWLVSPIIFGMIGASPKSYQKVSCLLIWSII